MTEIRSVEYISEWLFTDLRLSNNDNRAHWSTYEDDNGTAHTDYHITVDMVWTDAQGSRLSRTFHILVNPRTGALGDSQWFQVRRIQDTSNCIGIICVLL